MRKKPTRGSVLKRNFRAGFPDRKFGLDFHHKLPVDGVNQYDQEGERGEDRAGDECYERHIPGGGGRLGNCLGDDSGPVEHQPGQEKPY